MCSSFNDSLSLLSYYHKSSRGSSVKLGGINKTAHGSSYFFLHKVAASYEKRGSIISHIVRSSGWLLFVAVLLPILVLCQLPQETAVIGGSGSGGQLGAIVKWDFFFFFKKGERKRKRDRRKACSAFISQQRRRCYMESRCVAGLKRG